MTLILVGAVIAVGILHTLVPDHWVPITLLARQQGWSPLQTARAAFGAGLGHTLSTLAIAVLVWIAGAAFSRAFGHWIDIASGVALAGFGGWIAITSWRELDHHEDGHAHLGHGHLHTHPEGLVHRHWHEHHAHDWHAPESEQLHEHAHTAGGKTALLLILGSSPMVEGIPAFFAASKYGVTLLAIMAFFFALATIATYVLLCVASVAGLQRVNLGPLERYGEVLSGLFIALLGIVFLIWPVL